MKKQYETRLLSLIIFLLVLPVSSPVFGLTLDVTPSQVGADTAATVQVVADSSADSGYCDEIRISASRGSISAPVAGGDGKYSATLRFTPAGNSKKPGYIVVLATCLARGAPTSASVKIPVIANLKISGNASPESVMYAVSGESLLGEKVKVGADGTYSIQIPVRPGTDELEIVLEKGTRQMRNPLDIDFGGGVFGVMQAVPDLIKAYDSKAYVYYSGTNYYGASINSGSVSFSCNPGKCATPENLGGGIVRSIYEPPAVASYDNAKIDARVYGVPYAANIKLQLPGRLAKVELSGPGEVLSGTPYTFEIATFNELGEPFGGDEVYLVIDGERAGSAHANGEGAYSFSYAFEGLDDKTEYVVKAIAVTGAGAELESNILQVGIVKEVVTLAVTGDRETVGPGDKAVFRVTAKTQTGVPVGDLRLVAQAVAGEAGAVTELAAGEYVFQYTAPDVYVGQSIAVSVSSTEDENVFPVTTSIAWSDTADETAVTDTPETEEKTGAQLSLSASALQVSPGQVVTLTAGITGVDDIGESALELFLDGTSLGMMSSANGVFTMSVEAPDDLKTKIIFTASLVSETLSADDASVEVSMVRPSPAQLIVSVPASVTVLGYTQVEAEVRISDETGQGAGPYAVSLDVLDAGAEKTYTTETDEAGHATVLIETDYPAGVILISAYIEQHEDINTTASITKVTLPVNRIELSADKTSIDSDGVDEIEIEVFAVNEAGGDAVGERIEFVLQSGSGRISATNCETDTEGRCSIHYISGASCGTVSVRAYVYADDTVQDTLSVAENPRVPATIAKVGTVSALVANGTDETTIRVQVYDAGGCAVPNERILLSSVNGLGTVASELTTDGSGEINVTYRAGLVAGTDTISARSVRMPPVISYFDIELRQWAPVEFSVVPASTNQTAGSAFNVTISALDSQQNTVTTYSPVGSSFSFTGPSNAPDGTAPSYPSSASVAGAFSNGSAVIPVTLFMKESAAITVRYGSLAGQSASITIGAASPDKIQIVSGDNQSAKVNTQTGSDPVVRVLDSYENPVVGVTVSFTVTGGGTIANTSAVTDSDGRASPGSWTLGGTVGANTITASISSGTTTSVTFQAVATLTTPPTAVISSPASNVTICRGESVSFSAVGSSAEAPATIVSYAWDFDANGTTDSTVQVPGAKEYIAAGNYLISLTVTDSNGLSQTDSVTVTVAGDPGQLSLIASPFELEDDGIASAQIYSSLITDCHGAAIADNSLFTVSTTLGSITTADADGTAGIQVASSGGGIEFTLLSGTATGTALISASSLNTLYSDTLTVDIGLETTLPFVTSFAPAGYKNGSVNSITIFFSEKMEEDKLENAGLFTIKQGTSNVGGSRDYDTGTGILTFTPATPINMAGGIVTVEIRKNAVDLNKNKLDGQYIGAESDFSFSFGPLADQTLPSVTCTGDSPDPFSPDGVNGSGSDSDTTTFSFTATDETALLFWKVVVSSGATTIRTYSGSLGGGTSYNVTRDWDGRNQAGELLSNGVYTYTVTSFDTSYNESASCASTVQIANPINFGNTGP